MNEEYFWPLAGVFLGWVLTMLSSSMRNSGKKKQTIGNLMTKLIRVERQLGLIITATDNMKDFADSWEDYEPMRQGIVSRHFLVPEGVSDDLKSAIDDIAPLYPILATELETKYELLLKNKMASLSASSKSEEAYIRMLSIYEVGLDLSKSDLGNVISRLAWKHGALTFIRLKIENRRRKKNREKSQSSSDMILSEIRSELKKTHNKSRQKDASEAGASA